MRNIQFLIDTGAERTTINVDILKEAGYENHLEDGMVISTAKGNIQAHTTKLVTLEIMGKVYADFPVVAHGIHPMLPFDAILGMDFLEQQEFCIDSANQLIKLH